jgi:L-fuculose-phosphate aldolase
MSRSSAPAVRRAVIRACKRLDAKGHIAGAEGNVSARTGPTGLVVTPSGRCKGDLTAGELIAMRTDGSGVAARARPSSEISMHLAIYRARPDVGAIVHAHPVAATAFAVARRPIPSGTLAEVAAVVGPTPVVTYRTPGSAALGRAVSAALRTANVALLASHGAVAVGPTIDVALQRIESLEQAARTILAARLIGRPKTLKAAERRVLEQLWQSGAGHGLAKRAARGRGI